MNADPRLQERKQPERRVFCKLDGDESGSVLNLSEDGLCFESVTPIEEKGLLHLRLSLGMNSPIEATGRLAWVDSAKRMGGLRFLELNAPARQQIRAWLSEASAASRGTKAPTPQKRDKQANEGLAIEKLPPWQLVRVPSAQITSTQLVPIERHRSQMRWQFLRGVLLGCGICTAVMIASFQFVGGTGPGSLLWTTASANRAAQPSAAQAQVSVTPPASPGTTVSEPTAATPLPTQPTMQTVPAAAPIWPPQRQSPQTAGASPTGLKTRRTSVALAMPASATPQPAKAEQPLGENQPAVAPVQAASKPPSSSEQVQHAKKLPATPQQLWSLLQAGNTKAAVALADLYLRGEGVPVNCDQARILLQVALKKNNAEASKKLDELDKNGCPANSE